MPDAVTSGSKTGACACIYFRILQAVSRPAIRVLSLAYESEVRPDLICAGGNTGLGWVGFNLLNAELSPKKYCRGPRSQEVGDEGDYTVYLILHCHHQNHSCIKMGSGESHFGNTHLQWVL